MAQAVAPPSLAQLTSSSRCQGELGDVVYVELPQVGATMTAGSTFGVVESVKVRLPLVRRRRLALTRLPGCVRRVQPRVRHCH